MNARERLRAWRGTRSFREMGELLGCDGSFISHVEHRRKYPGRKLANAIEIHSASWAHGPIRAVAWDELERVEDEERNGGSDPVPGAA